MPSALELVFALFEFVFLFWPLMILSGVKTQGDIFAYMLRLWLFLGTIWLFLLFNPEPFSIGFFIPEPWNTVAFFTCGAVLTGIHEGRKYWNKNQLLHKVGKVNQPSDLLDLSPSEFEDMAVELFTSYGHKAKRTGAVGDHGVDVLVETKTGEKCVVQCKRWKGAVGEPAIRDFYGVTMHEKADKGIIITSGKFTQPAQKWAKGKPLTLYNGEKFIELWLRSQAKKAPKQKKSVVPVS